MSLQHIQKNSPRLLPKPAKFEKNPPNGYRVIRKTKCGAAGAAGAGGAGSSPIHKQASRKWVYHLAVWTSILNAISFDIGDNIVIKVKSVNDKNEAALMKKKSPIKYVNICIISNRNCELYCIVYVTCPYFHL